MEYKVKITPFALSQLSETVNYISGVLLVPETAERWLDVLQSSIKSLSLLLVPFLFPYKTKIGGPFSDMVPPFLME